MFVAFLSKRSTFFENLEEFLKLRDLPIRNSFNINNTPITSRGRNAVEGVVSNIDTSPKDAINTATSATSNTIQAQIHDLKSHLPRYYTIVYSDPSTSFSFNLSTVLNSAPKKVSEILPDIDQSFISGYLLAGRKLFLSKGSRLLAIFYAVYGTRKDTGEGC
ncbi:unnamed protein product [Penicillium camemberti]|uniref:Str. FM013 n=1 Tax=Penicillium camemberti (strain FM 013) TaxID=1429867 RepID=A0A0G4PVW6_PENC3|nr:unnamed protein product [Penicillium camemberti]